MNTSPSGSARVTRPARSEPARGLGQELHPQLAPLEHGRDVPALLLLGPEVEQRGGQDAERGYVEEHRHLVLGRLLGEDGWWAR